MLKRDVRVGGIYLTKVGGELVHVRVVGITTTEARGTYAARATGRVRSMEKFRVARLDSGNVLPKPRSAAALRPAALPEGVA